MIHVRCDDVAHSNYRCCSRVIKLPCESMGRDCPLHQSASHFHFSISQQTCLISVQYTMSPLVWCQHCSRLRFDIDTVSHTKCTSLTSWGAKQHSGMMQADECRQMALNSVTFCSGTWSNQQCIYHRCNANWHSSSRNSVTVNASDQVNTTCFVGRSPILFFSS